MVILVVQCIGIEIEMKTDAFVTVTVLCKYTLFFVPERFTALKFAEENFSVDGIHIYGNHALLSFSREHSMKNITRDLKYLFQCWYILLVKDEINTDY